MAILFTSLSGNVYLRRDGGTTPIFQSRPTQYRGNNVKPCLIPWEVRRLFMIGQHSRGLVRCENRRIYAVGMSAPVVVPGITPGSGSGGTEGLLIPYVTFRHKINGLIVAESNPIGGIPVQFTGASHVWSPLPTEDPEERATHVVGYLKRDEAVAREVFEIPIGNDTFEENVPALSWGKQISFRRGVPPYCTFAVAYHDRMWYGGDPLREWAVWYSELNEPEAVSEDAFIPTRDRDAVSAMAKANEDQLAVMSRRQFYDIQGYRGAELGVAADFNMRKVDPSIGCISHHSVVNIHDRLVFAAEKGLAIFDGAPRYVSLPKLEEFWFDDYAAWRERYERSWAMDDDTKSVYKLCIEKPGAPQESFYYILNYKDIEPKIGTPQLGIPRFGFDVRTRRDSAGAMMLATEGTRLRKAYTASCDGQIREENISTNANDDGDAYLKRMWVQPRHDYYEELGGDRWHGKQYPEFGLFLKNETNVATLSFYPGDDSAPQGVPPTIAGVCTIPAGAIAGKVSREDYFLRPYITGQGLTFVLIVISPVGVEYAGNYGAWKEGLQTRPRTP